jgi:dolichol kinase
MKKEILRKIFHIISVLSLLIPLKLFGKYSITFLMVIMLIIFYPVSKFKIKNKLTKPFWILLEFVERDKNFKILPARQAFALALGLIITSLIFNEKIVEISIISLAIYDGFATISGKLFGKIELINNRTLEGSLSGIIANTVFLSFIINPATALLISIFVAFVEMLSSSEYVLNDDNFLIPVLTGFFSYFLYLNGALSP